MAQFWGGVQDEVSLRQGPAKPRYDLLHGDTVRLAAPGSNFAQSSPQA